MVDVTVTVQNDEIERIRSWIEEQERDMVSEMVAPVVTRTTDRANTVFRLLGQLDQQLHGFEILLAEREEAARKARRKR